MVQSMAAMAAEYHVSQYKAHYHLNRVIGRTDEEAWDRLQRFLDALCARALPRGRAYPLVLTPGRLCARGCLELPARGVLVDRAARRLLAR